jgi:hypothetical protein
MISSARGRALSRYHKRGEVGSAQILGLLWHSVPRFFRRVLRRRPAPSRHTDSICGIDRTNGMDQRQASKYVQRIFAEFSRPTRSREAD